MMKGVGMFEHGPFLLVTILVLVTILLIFAMKYFSTARQVRLGIAGANDYRELAQKAVQLHSDSATFMANTQSDLSEIKNRLAAVEKLLKDVG
jgi:biopolymer transport protein ExbD